MFDRFVIYVGCGSWCYGILNGFGNCGCWIVRVVCFFVGLEEGGCFVWEDGFVRINIMFKEFWGI